MAVDRVERLLRKVATALDQARVPYAVIGGNAVAVWVSQVDEDAVRATKDVDILLRRTDLPAVTEALQTVELMPIDVLGVTMFVDRERPSPKAGVHVVFANELIRPDYKHPAPDVTESVRADDGFSVIDLAALVRMKLLAFRRIDQVHIEDLLAANLIDAALVDSLPPDLASRLREIRDTQR